MPPTANARGSTVTARAVMPWKTSKKWDGAAIADYHQSSQSWLRAKAEAGLVRDCADTSITLVIEYAASKGLPVAFNKKPFDPKVITNQVGWVYYKDGGYPRDKKVPWRKLSDATKLDSLIRMFWNANMIATEGHTKKIAHADAKPGDLLLFDWSTSTHWHTILVGERDAEDLPCWLVMGNLDDNNQPTPLELVDRATQRDRVERYWTHADMYQGSPRRWDFDFFNASSK